MPDRTASPRSQALADLPTLMRLVAAVSEVDPVYGTWVMLCALLSVTRSSLHADTRHLTEAATAVTRSWACPGHRLVTRLFRSFGSSTTDARTRRGPSPGETGEGRYVGMTGFEPATP